MDEGEWGTERKGNRKGLEKGNGEGKKGDGIKKWEGKKRSGSIKREMEK